jgi:(4-(4-[2-(gamma-L-glutamylamino)ethyl]phenoxymethyl)furan-2-yl)methanamine synthase
MGSIVGWDIGGVNIKAARFVASDKPRAVLEPFELQRAPARLAPTLKVIAARLEAQPDDTHAVTMTAELSQYFRTKREGVAFVLDALDTALIGAPLHVFGTEGVFRSVDQARADPLGVAAANWAATAHLIARSSGTCLLIDIGSTTTDIVPIVAGVVTVVGRIDPERLASGELVYTGALRTPTEAVAHDVPLRGERAGVSAEGFATMGDVHLWLGSLAPEDYTVPTPDGRPATREFAGERLARVVCGDREILSDADIDAIATQLAAAQVACIVDAIQRVRARHNQVAEAVVTGLGDFIAAEAAERAGLTYVRLADRLGEDCARAAPAAAVAILLNESIALGRSS